jgi:small subunit ribosomal protein S35
MGEQHPAAKKVVVEFCPADLPDLTEPQRTKLIKLAGPRYNPSTDIVKMSCESFETQAQNKRYLGDLVDKLVTTAKDSKDNFEDIPLDFRHHTAKPFYQFPEQWKLTPERKKALEEKRVKALEAEGKKRLDGRVVDGVNVIEDAMKRLGMRQILEQNVAATVGAKPGAKLGAKPGAPVRGRVGLPSSNPSSLKRF